MFFVFLFGLGVWEFIENLLVVWGRGFIIRGLEVTL